MLDWERLVADGFFSKGKRSGEEIEYGFKRKGVGYFTDSVGAKKQATTPFCMPQDIVEASIQQKKGVFFGRLNQIIKESPDRITPRCIHFGTCGSCRFQEIPYQQQLLQKQNLGTEEFQGLFSPRLMIGCETPYGY